METSKEEEKVLLQKAIRNLLSKPVNEWERKFLQSIEEQILNRDLSPKQMRILNEMWGIRFELRRFPEIISADRCI